MVACIKHQLETAEYSYAIVQELQRLAEKSSLITLSYLLELAAEEARAAERHARLMIAAAAENESRTTPAAARTPASSSAVSLATLLADGRAR